MCVMTNREMMGIKRTDQMEVVHIYHTNDLHSHFKDWPRIVALLKERKRWHESVGDPIFIFDIGDHVDRWHPLSDATFGKGNVTLLNSAAYDGVTIGNNEGITLPHDHLNNLYDQADFPVLVANLYDKDGSRPNWAKPHVIYSTETGTKIGVIGLTANFTPFYEQLQWIVTDPIEELSSQLLELPREVDVIILLSHLGLKVDEQIAHLYPQIDVILGAHTHHILHEGKLVNRTLLAGAGKFGNYVGHVTITIEATTKHVINKKAWLYDTNELPALDGENAMITNLFMMGESLLQTEVTDLKSEYNTWQIAKLLCQALWEWCEADCALVNEGLIIAPLGKGIVTKFDLLQICPHPINPCILHVSGEQLTEIITHALDKKWTNFRMMGFGFRGTFIGKFLFDQIEFIEGEIYVQNEPINIDKTYKVAIPDMFTFGQLFPEISNTKDKHYLLPEFLRDLLQWQLSKTSL